MRPRFLTAPIAAVAALVLLVATVGGLVLADQAASPDPAPTVVPAEAGTQRGGEETQAAPTATPEPAPTVDAGTGTAPFELPPLPAKSVEVVEVSERSPVPSGPVSRAAREAAAAEVKGQQGQVYSWQDGDRTLNVVLQNDLGVQETVDIKSDDVVVVAGGDTSIVERRPGHGSVEPVFRDESGGGLMTLPGGVLVALDPQWDQEQVDEFFERNGIDADRVSEMGFIPNGFVVQTEPGFPSLELANALAGQDGVTVSSPNWWREVQAK